MPDRDFGLSLREERLDDYVVVQAQANPATGAQAPAWTVPGGQVWVPKAVRINLTCSATVANRVPKLVVADGTRTIAESYAPGAQTANAAVVTYTWMEVGATAGTQASGFGMTLPITPFPLLPGWTIQASVTGLQAGDIIVAVTIAYEVLDEGKLHQYGGLALAQSIEKMVWDAARIELSSLLP